MSPSELERAIAQGAVVLDMRLPKIFAKEHVPGAVNVQFNRADLAERMEMVFPKDLPFLVCAEPEAIARLAVDLLQTAGFHVDGYLEGGLKAWKETGRGTHRLPVLTVDAVNEGLDRMVVVDAREPFEYKHGHVPGAQLLPWTEAWERAATVTSDQPIAVICGDEVRSALVASILARTHPSVQLVTGGMVDWNERGFAVERGLSV